MTPHFQVVWKFLENRGTYIPLYDTSYDGLKIPIKAEETKPQPSNPTPSLEEPKIGKNPKELTESVIKEAKDLAHLALQSTLTVPQQQKLLALLDKDPNVVYEIDITPYQVC